MSNVFHRRRGLLGLAGALSALGLLQVAGLAGCASKPPVRQNQHDRKERPVHANGQRIPDSVPERLESLPGVDEYSDPENVERRFGHKAAKAHREKQKRDREARRKHVNVQDFRPGAKADDGNEAPPPIPDPGQQRKD